jgi:hypothetical protein
MGVAGASFKRSAPSPASLRSAPSPAVRERGFWRALVCVSPSPASRER